MKTQYVLTLSLSRAGGGKTQYYATSGSGSLSGIGINQQLVTEPYNS